MVGPSRIAGLLHPPRPPVSQLAQGRSLAAATAVAASLMRVLARDDGEQIWLPSLPEGLEIPRLAGLPNPMLRSAGDLDAGADPSLIAWAETPWVAGLRARLPAPPRDEGPRENALAEDDSHRAGAISPSAFRARLRHLPAPTPAAAALANHRSLSLALARRRAWSLPGETMIHEIEGLQRHLDALDVEATEAPTEAPAWVLKAAWSAAGRDRVFSQGSSLDDPQLSARIAALLRQSASLRFEPWMRRDADFGCVGLALSEGPRLLGMHRLHCDRRGVFRAIELCRAGDLGQQAEVLGLSAAEQAALLEAFEAAGRELARVDYRGPFGIDAWRYRDHAGRPGFQPLGEINARLTMGHLAHLLLDRLESSGAGAGVGEGRGGRASAGDGLMRLELGRRSGALSEGSQVLASADGFMAWLAPARAETGRR
jgi:hypothetical protein